MKKSRFSEAQIVGILKEVEVGAKVAGPCRKHGVSKPTYYKWKSQFSGMTVSHLAQLRQLQDENAKLKRMYADLALMHHALKDVIDRKPDPGASRDGRSSPCDRARHERADVPRN